MKKEYGHQTVLLTEAVSALNPKPAGIYIDATFGRGGHSRELLRHLSREGRVIGIDQDPQANQVGHGIAAEDARFEMVKASFADLDSIVTQRQLLGKVDGVLLDLGVSSPQLDDPERGFSFLKDGPLDMRMDPTLGVDAASWIYTATESEIANVLKTYGEERFSKRIAHAIVEARAKAPITRTLELAEIVRAANPKWEKHKHPATRSFQAIRIFINRELEALEKALHACLKVLAIGGRLVVISFHSLEDRIVKRFMRDHSRDSLPRSVPLRASQIQAAFQLIGRAIKPGQSELEANPRARSAVMRTMERMI